MERKEDPAPATRTCGRQSQVQQKRPEIRNFEGVTGVFSFDEHGNPMMDATILQLRGGEYVEFK